MKQIHFTLHSQPSDSMLNRADDQRIAAVLDAGHITESRSLAHALKGSAGTLGLTGIQRLAAAVELPPKQERSDAIDAAKAALDELSATLPVLIAKLDAAISLSQGFKPFAGTMSDLLRFI